MIMRKKSNIQSNQILFCLFYFILWWKQASIESNDKNITFKTALKQWSQTQYLEGHSSAEFSSKQLQITPAWKFL